MICFINRSTVDYDIRLCKYVQACIETGISYEVIAWDRLNNAEKVYPHEHQLKIYAPYGNRWRNLLSLVCWIFYVWGNLLKYFAKYKVIHAVNLENYLIAYPFKMFGKKVIIDVYDSYSIQREHKIVRNADMAILPTEKRLKQIGLKKEDLKNFLEIENVLTYTGGDIKIVKHPDDKIYLAYVGTMQQRIRGIENVLDVVVEDERFVFNIAGTGDGMDEIVSEYAKKCDRIHYYGKVQYNKALEIMKNSDFIVALYYLLAPTHKYASPNKFHESLFLGTPIITSKNTLVGDRVDEANTGYTVEDTKEAFLSIFEHWGESEFMVAYKQKVENCQKLWNSVYVTYKEVVLEGAYINAMKKLAGKSKN